MGSFSSSSWVGNLDGVWADADRIKPESRIREKMLQKTLRFNMIKFFIVLDFNE